MQRLGLRIGASLALTATSAALSAPPDSSPTQTRSACPAAATLVPQAAWTQRGPGRLSITERTNIVLAPSAPATAHYAAQCLRAEFSRLFGIDMTVLPQRNGHGPEGISIFLNDADESPRPHGFARLRELPHAGEDGYQLGVLPAENAAVVLGHGGNGVIRGAFALAQLAADDGRGCFLPELLVSDTPEMRMRFTRGILSDLQLSSEMSAEERLTCALDWWARWGLNYAIIPHEATSAVQEQDRRIRWFVEAAHSRGMKAGASLGGRSLCPSDAAAMHDYLARARHLLTLGCDFLLVLFDDLPRERLAGHCQRCVRRFGGSLAAEQRFILEAVADVLSEFAADRRLIWCPTYYSLGMTGYIGGAEGPDAYFSILGRSARVRQAYMFHCAFDRRFNAYLDAKGIKHRVWWYNGIRTAYYMVSRDFGDYQGWGPRLTIPGLKDFRGFFSPFENGWLMPGYDSADPSLHPCLAPLAQAARDEHGRTIIPPASWRELAHLPECMGGVYLCGASDPYAIALAAVFGTHPARFDQDKAQQAILDAIFSRGGSRYAVPWQRAYSQAQLLLAHSQGRPLTADGRAAIRRLLAEMEAMHQSLRQCAAAGKAALPRPVVEGLLAEMRQWQARIDSLAAGTPRRKTP
ncbi:MAG: glycoside hydrolase family 20 zincin-like fold domain-containing protein [Phycisphaerae bacterium]